MNSQIFQVDTEKFIFQAIEDEIIVINLENGNYYSLAGLASSLWNALGQGASAEQLIHATLSHYTDSHEAVISAEIATFLSELESEAMIITQPNDGNITTKLTLDGLSADYQTPQIEKFTNMSDLLLLDPIHDVDEQGWPVRKA